MKTFDGLLKSEIKKVEKAINKATGFSDCRITGYYSEEKKPFDFDPDCTWVDVTCEICRNYEDVVEGYEVILCIPMFDRRKSFVHVYDLESNRLY